MSAVNEMIAGTVVDKEAERVRAENRAFVKSQQPEVVRKDIRFRVNSPEEERQTMKTEVKRGRRGGAEMHARGQVLAPIRARCHERWKQGDITVRDMKQQLEQEFNTVLKTSTVNTWCTRKLKRSRVHDKVHEKVHEKVHQNGPCINCLNTLLHDLEELVRADPDLAKVSRWLQGVRVGMAISKR